MFSTKKITKKHLAIGGGVSVIVIAVAVYYYINRCKSCSSCNNSYFSISNSKSQRTFAMIKPDAYENAEKIKTRIANEGFRIIESRSLKVTTQQARMFYREHEERPFYAELVEYMTQGNVWVLVLEAENAVAKWRHVMGPTDAAKAKQTDPNSIRALFGESISANACHGSDSIEAAKREIAFFFDV